MRKILFRGKAINRDKGDHRSNYKNGDWVYGLLSKKYDKRFENLPAEMTNENGISGIEIDYRTIGQYTGLTDKNGKKIFEGDILSFKNNDGEFSNYEVIWFGNRWEVIQNGSQFADELDIFFCERSAIIGNIHDNPELLKEA